MRDPDIDFPAFFLFPLHRGQIKRPKDQRLHSPWKLRRISAIGVEWRRQTSSLLNKASVVVVVTAHGFISWRRHDSTKMRSPPPRPNCCWSFPPSHARVRVFGLFWSIEGRRPTWRWTGASLLLLKRPLLPGSSHSILNQSDAFSLSPRAKCFRDVQQFERDRMKMRNVSLTPRSCPSTNTCGMTTRLRFIRSFSSCCTWRFIDTSRSS